MLVDSSGMAKVKEGDRVRILAREVTAQDKSVHMFFEHMQGLTGVVSNYYGVDEVAVTVDLDALTGIPADVHQQATRKMREKFQENATEDVRKALSKEELNFTPHYVLLVREEDLEKI